MHLVAMSLMIFLQLCVRGAETDEVVSAMEGGSFTLRTGFTERSGDHEIEWRFGSSRTLLIRIKAGNIITSNDTSHTIFRDRLLLERQTGDLTITNITNEHTGVYELSIDLGQTELQKKFIVAVYAPVPVPVITRYSPQCSSSSSSSSGFKRVLLCSVVNVSDVTLSWYKGNSLLSSISVSDLMNNPVSTQTTHLDIDQLCQTCSGRTLVISAFLHSTLNTSTRYLKTVRMCFCKLHIWYILCLFFHCLANCGCLEIKVLP
uniref:Ig-like domain-containing protein n=1 Tax=Sinocyclocheilus anshuiensis TaxID=1608454 RepID=A0A671SI49_9TELE